jgi:hypothetical protein
VYYLWAIWKHTPTKVGNRDCLVARDKLRSGSRAFSHRVDWWLMPMEEQRWRSKAQVYSKQVMPCISRRPMCDLWRQWLPAEKRGSGTDLGLGGFMSV